MRVPEVIYRVEEWRDGEWVLLAELAAKQYARPVQRFNAHERARGEACAYLHTCDLPRRVLAPDGSLLDRTKGVG